MQEAPVVAPDLDPVVAQEADQVLDQSLRVLRQGSALKLPAQDRSLQLPRVALQVLQSQRRRAGVQVDADVGCAAWLRPEQQAEAPERREMVRQKLKAAYGEEGAGDIDRLPLVAAQQLREDAAHARGLVAVVYDVRKSHLLPPALAVAELPQPPTASSTIAISSAVRP